MHSFGLTDRYVILFEQPLVVDPMRLALSNKPLIENYRWKPERGTRFLVIDREDGSLRAAVEAEAFFTFHHVNAFEDGRELVVDLVGADDPSVIDGLYLDQLRGEGRPVSPSTLRRYRLPLDGGSARREDIFPRPMELPRIAYRTRNGRPYRWMYAVGAAGPGVFDSVLKVDVEDGSAVRWQEDGCYPGEPVFVPQPGADGEDDGVVLSVVLDSRAGRSFLLVLDAVQLRGGGSRRGPAPHTIRIPRPVRQRGGVAMCGHRRRSEVRWIRDTDVRASQDERERVVDRLRTHAGEGRLELDELEQRVEAALSARTRGELNEVLHDLPGCRTRRPTGVAAPWRVPRPRWRSCRS